MIGRSGAGPSAMVGGMKPALRTNCPTANCLWIGRFPLGAGYAGPTVADGRVYVMDRATSADGATQNERVLCVSSKDGTTLWEHTYAAPYKIQYTAGPGPVSLSTGVSPMPWARWAISSRSMRPVAKFSGNMI